MGIIDSTAQGPASDLSGNPVYEAWVPFYEEFADRLLDYRGDHGALIALVHRVYDGLGMELPTMKFVGRHPAEEHGGSVADDWEGGLHGAASVVSEPWMTRISVLPPMSRMPDTGKVLASITII